jgi:hypothetical protein
VSIYFKGQDFIEPCYVLLFIFILKTNGDILGKKKIKKSRKRVHFPQCTEKNQTKKTMNRGKQTQKTETEWTMKKQT